MRLKTYYKDILSLVGAVLLLGTTILINKYDVKQLYREFATLSLKVNAQEKKIESLEDRVNVLVVQNQRLLNDLEQHNKTRGSENVLLLERLYDLEQKVEILSSKPLVSMTKGKVFNDRFEFEDKQVNRIGQYETKGQVLVAWRDDYLTTKKVNVNTIGEINLSPKIKKLDKDKFVSYIDESYLGGITIRGRGEIQQIEPPRNQFSVGPFIGVAYNNTTGLTEPVIGIGVTYNMLKIWDWR
jgi:DNA uptake protein ComE-like DNA-binding protein